MASILDKISEFWNWFSEHKKMLGQAAISQDLVEQLEKHLFAIEHFDWEIGPALDGGNRFALSPAGDKNKLKLTQEIVKKAPSLEGWEFCAAKPPRIWDLSFSLLIENNSVKIEGRQWEFIAYKFKDGTYDLLFKPSPSPKLDEQFQYWAATIIVDGELGEQKRMETIANIEIVEDWTSDLRKSAQKLERGLLQKIIK